MNPENYMDNDPLHQDELIQQKNRLVHQTKLNQFETVMSPYKLDPVTYFPIFQVN